MIFHLLKELDFIHVVPSAPHFLSDNSTAGRYSRGKTSHTRKYATMKFMLVKFKGIYTDVTFKIPKNKITTIFK